MTFSSPPLHQQTPNLDLLRALAVVLVLLDHVLETIGHQIGSSFHPHDWYAGRLGVLLFFVHTSIVLMASMERMQLQGWQLFRSFYIRRTFRIYPLSLLCVIGVVIAGVPELPWEDYKPTSTGGIVSNLLLTMNLTYSVPVLAPLWSLPLEVQMYAALPFIFIFLGRYPTISRLAVIYALMVVLALTLPMVSSRFSGAMFGPCFMAGVIGHSFHYRAKKVFAAWLFPVFLLLTIGIYFLIEDAIPGIHHRWLQWLICLLVGLAIPLCRQSNVGAVNYCTHHIAKYSYGIYLFHCIALWIGCYQLQSTPAIQWIATALILVVLSVVSFHSLEQPAMSLGARLSRPILRKIPQPA
jgi:peptidoglycan/LPS O-acetylase OafA/YrhL